MMNPCNYQPSDEDILDVLTATKNQADDPLKLEHIRSVLVEVCQRKKDSEQTIDTHVKEEHIHDDLVQRLSSILPQRESAISHKSHGMLPCAIMLLEIYKIFITVLGNIIGNTKPRSFRNVLEKMEIVFDRVFLSKRQIKDAALLNISAESRRSYLRNATRPVEGYQMCAVCGHGYVDYPKSNDGVAERNQTKLDAYNLKCQEVEREKMTNPNSVSQTMTIYNFLYINTQLAFYFIV